jgi:formylglycine-generating enzyme required for sulfatase activity
LVSERVGHRILLGAMLLGFFGCAEGIAPPRTTEGVRITTGLSFKFGPEEPCVGDDETSLCDKEYPNPKSEQMVAPQVEMTLLAYEIDAHEVTNLQYRYCVAMGTCEKPDANNAPGTPGIDSYYSARFIDWNNAYDHHPVLNVSHADAEAYCAFVAKRLPAEAEWERAARGEAGSRKYPAEGMDSAAWCKEKKLATAYCQGLESLGQANLEQTPYPNWDETTRKYLEVSTPDHVIEGGFKIYHLLGNVAEWTADVHQPDVTCDSKGSSQLNCKPCTACEGESGASLRTCKKDCEDCPACPYVNSQNSLCWYACAGTKEFQSYLCKRRADSGPDPRTSLATEAAADKNDYVVRGASVLDSSATSACVHRSAFRDRQGLTSNSGSYLNVGFRCARTIGDTTPL